MSTSRPHDSADRTGADAIGAAVTDLWLDGADICPSPNYNDRPNVPIDLLVIHNISLPPREFGGPYVRQLFQNQLDASAHPYFATIAGLKVSAHFFIDRQGTLVQFVPLNRRAWHAGASQFAGVCDCNDYSIGIELEGADDIPYTAAQYARLVQTTRLLQAQFPLISAERITGHADIAPTRKTDPGPAFDWTRYRQMLGCE